MNSNHYYWKNKYNSFTKQYYTDYFQDNYHFMPLFGVKILLIPVYSIGKMV